MTQEQIHILKLLSSEDNANVQLGLELLQSQNITIPILEKFKKAISFMGMEIEQQAENFSSYRYLGYGDYQYKVAKDIFEGVVNCTNEDINLNILTMDKDLYNYEIYEQIGADPYTKKDFFIYFPKEEEHA